MDRAAIIKALRDTAQSASNTVAEGVSGPVDLIASGLRGAGVPLPRNHVGGSRWMAENGLTAPVQDGVPKVAGEAIGMSLPIMAQGMSRKMASEMMR